MSKSYPFLAIAKRFNLDYGDVLLFADIRRQHTGSPQHPWTPHHAMTCKRLSRLSLQTGCDLDDAIDEANSTFKAIQSGKIDWQSI